MERDVRFRIGLALLIALPSFSIPAESSPVPSDGGISDERVTSFSGWTSGLGAVDPRREERLQVNLRTATWDGAVATYNLISTPGVGSEPSVFIPATAAVEATGRPVATAMLEGLRSAAVPAPLAWWLLMAGLVGVVGISRRRGGHSV